MKLRLAFLLSLFSSLICVLALPLWIVRYALFTPDFYRRWSRESDFPAHLSAALATDLPHRIPVALWPAWIPREPTALRALLDYGLMLSEPENLLAQVGPSWACWGLGEASAPERLTPVLARLLSTERGENIRAYLWRALPSCAAGTPPACVPLDPGDHAAVGQQQQAWWNGFTGDLIAVCDTLETEAIGAWQAPAWLPWIWYAPLVALLGAVIAALLIADRRRWACFSVPLLTTGFFVGLTGVLARLDKLPPPDIRVWSGIPFSAATIAVFEPLWYGLWRGLGPLFLMGGAAALALGLLCLVLVFEGRVARWLAVLGSLLALGMGAQFYPASFLTALPSLPEPLVEFTPTPWPTLTATPTRTPTPTLTPTPYYWPVQPGTPVPTPAGALTEAAQLLGCVRGVEAPVRAVQLSADEMHVLYTATTQRYRFPTLLSLIQMTNPLTATTFALAADATQIAVAHERNLYLYTFLAWTRALRSRVSTFSRIQTLTYAVGQEQLVLGLENGYLWVIDPTNGAIVWLLAAGNSPLTALAAHPTQPLVLAGAADGLVYLWDMTNGAQVAVFEGHQTAVQFLVFAPQDTLALSVDADGQWILWDLAGKTLLRRRTPPPDVALSVLLWTKEGIIGGTTNGELLFVGEELSLTRRQVSADAITALSVAPSGTAVIGFATGELCLWGVLDVP